MELRQENLKGSCIQVPSCSFLREKAAALFVIFVDMAVPLQVPICPGCRRIDDSFSLLDTAVVLRNFIESLFFIFKIASEIRQFTPL
jgi:hypothetical protein